MASFWEKLKLVGAGANTLGRISLDSFYLRAQNDQMVTLLSGKQVIGHEGVIRVKAQPLADGSGYSLTDCTEVSAEVAEVYWLPWQSGAVTVTPRAVFEQTKRELFFLTSTLSGCRFTVTPDTVMHIAHNLGGSAGGGTAGRSAAEQAITGARAAATRRVSVSGDLANVNNFRYGGAGAGGSYRQALVFGMRKYISTEHGVKKYGFTYKLLSYEDPPQGAPAGTTAPSSWRIVL